MKEAGFHVPDSFDKLPEMINKAPFYVQELSPIVVIIITTIIANITVTIIII